MTSATSDCHAPQRAGCKDADGHWRVAATWDFPWDFPRSQASRLTLRGLVGQGDGGHRQQQQRQQGQQVVQAVVVDAARSRRRRRRGPSSWAGGDDDPLPGAALGCVHGGGRIPTEREYAARRAPRRLQGGGGAGREGRGVRRGAIGRAVNDTPHSGRAARAPQGPAGHGIKGT